MINFDLVHNGLPGAIGTYLRLDPEPMIVDCGPSTSLAELSQGLEQHGVRVGDLRHILLTHVHLDHAGGAGHLVRQNPRLTVHVHEDGAPHIADPEKLVASTRRTFGDLHDQLWGDVWPVPKDNIRAWRPGESFKLVPLRPIRTPGHIAHHLAWLDESDGTLMAGDALGIILGEGVPTHPATPPPSVDLTVWPETLATIAGVGPERVGVTHFGIHHDVADRIAQMRERLGELTRRVSAALDRQDPADREAYGAEVTEYLSEFADPDQVARYFECFSGRSDWDGVAFYLERNPLPDWVT